MRAQTGSRAKYISEVSIFFILFFLFKFLVYDDRAVYCSFSKKKQTKRNKLRPETNFVYLWGGCVLVLIKELGFGV